jgi:peptidoglycan/xylan/chitin deacetylase (PgdA/CDA1 family)
VGSERYGSGPEEADEGSRKGPLVVFDGTPESEVRDDLPDFEMSGAPPHWVALTFDDGPDLWTESVMDVLAENGAKATFFMLGYKVRSNPELAQAVVDAGHEVANHTFNHPALDRCNNAAVLQELADCSTTIFQITGQTPYFYRAPFLNDSKVARAAGLALGMFSVGADVICNDWIERDYRKITQSITTGVHQQGGRIVLLHDGIPADRRGSREFTVKAIEHAIPWLQEKGYEFVTISDLAGRVRAA